MSEDVCRRDSLNGIRTLIGLCVLFTFFFFIILFSLLFSVNLKANPKISKPNHICNVVNRDFWNVNKKYCIFFYNEKKD